MADVFNDRDIVELLRLRLIERIPTDEETDDVSTMLLSDSLVLCETKRTNLLVLIAGGLAFKGSLSGYITPLDLTHLDAFEPLVALIFIPFQRPYVLSYRDS